MRPIIVVKVGGSLFDLPELSQRLQRLLKLLDHRRVCLVAGGGASADIVRALQPIHRLADAAAHRIAMESMRVGEQLLCELLAGSVLINSACEVGDGDAYVVQAAGFISNRQPTGIALGAQDWSVTSDSIAAWVASTLGADELLLIKSAPAPEYLPSRGSDLVDDAFFQHAASLQVSWCDLRHGESIVRLHRNT